MMGWNNIENLEEQASYFFFSYFLGGGTTGERENCYVKNQQ
jgi:hypothetical protein